MKAVLSIAGSDSSGGAGIQADIKTITAHQLFAETAITALTAQNTTGVFGIQNINPAFVAQQIDVVYDDIRPDAVKIGMVSSIEIIEVIAQRLNANDATNIVVDPVMVATSGGKLIHDDAIEALKSYLFPLANIVTPNISEAEILCDMHISTEEAQEEAARVITKMCGGAVLVKGGHGGQKANDVLVTAEGMATWFREDRIDTKNTHGTGCTLSSAIACNLALGYSMDEATLKAKQYVTGALLHDLYLGRGSGPVNHMWKMGIFPKSKSEK